MNLCPVCEIEVPNKEHRHPAREAIEKLTAKIKEWKS